VEFAAGTIPGAINIELDHLRERLSEIDAKRPVLVFCQVGQRGYNAARVLMNSGRRETYNLGGGYAMYASGSR
jgi:tRNA 2-thiouridine synthesizing protein A